MPSLYDISAPAFIRGLTSLSHILTVGEQYAKDNKLPESDLTEGRLVADQLPLTFQIQSASNAVRNVLVLVANQSSIPQLANDEKSFADLQNRIAETIKWVKSVDAKAFEGAKDRVFERQGKKWTGWDFLSQNAIPNFYFHVTTAYAILRAKGVQIGKNDYLNGGQK
jgi:uncharacterized protein